VTLDGCESTALLWFYSDVKEGPFPSGSVVRNSTLRQGRGHLRDALIINGWQAGTEHPDQPIPADALPLQGILLENNEFHGGVSCRNAGSLVFRKNRFADGSSALQSTNCPGLVNE
jgi:hypothetical protein